MNFDVTVAKTALWIAESQMMKETESIIHSNLDFLPLKTNAFIVEGNALRLDWADIVSPSELNYIMGNPPFVGYAYQTKEQKNDLSESTKIKAKNLDYVAGWYYKATEFIQNTNIRVAFVSTNSITQGEQVAVVWQPLYQQYNIHIDFAYRTFRWDSEANIKAHVHCVIVGFSIAHNNKERLLFDNGIVKKTKNINCYLTSAPDVFIQRRSKPICNVSSMHRGSQPTDNGNFIFTEEEYFDFIKKFPETKKLFRQFMQSKDFIDKKPRYCLWLIDANPTDIKKFKPIVDRIKAIREFRLKSSKVATQKKAETPTLFDEIQQPKTNYIAIPETSSEKRKYIPICFMSPDIVVGNAIRIIENATLYHFGVLTSNVHMAWIRELSQGDWKCVIDTPIQ